MMNCRFVMVYYSLMIFLSCSMTFGSSRVVMLPVTFPVLTSSLRSLRMIFPDRVLGRAGAKWMLSGLAMAPMILPTWFLSSVLRAGDGVMFVLRVTKQTMASPLTSCGLATTAASATDLWATSELSISAVPSLCPETFRTSSSLPTM